MIARPRTVAFAKVLAANGVASGIIGVGLRELVSDFAADVGTRTWCEAAYAWPSGPLWAHANFETCQQPPSRTKIDAREAIRLHPSHPVRHGHYVTVT